MNQVGKAQSGTPDEIVFPDAPTGVDVRTPQPRNVIAARLVDVSNWIDEVVRQSRLEFIHETAALRIIGRDDVE